MGPDFEHTFDDHEIISEVRGENGFASWLLAERIESALAIPKTVFHQVAPANEADASRDEHADIDQLAVPAERQPAPTGPIHKLFGYLFRTWLRRWVARLEWH